MRVVLVHRKLKVDPLGVLIILQQIAENITDIHRTTAAKVVPSIVCSKSSKERVRVNVYRGRRLRSILRTAKLEPNCIILQLGTEPVIFLFLQARYIVAILEVCCCETRPHGIKIRTIVGVSHASSCRQKEPEVDETKPFKAFAGCSVCRFQRCQARVDAHELPVLR